MTRPDAHRIGDVGEVIVEKAFLKAGWIMNRLHRDYGFDFIAQYVRWSRPTWAYAFIQVKSVETRLTANRDGVIPFSVAIDHVGNWAKAPVPAFLAICEIETERVFLVSCHEISLSIRLRYGSEGLQSTARTIYLEPSSLLSSALFRKMTREILRFWQPLRPTRMENMALLSNVSEPGWARAMASWIASYWSRRDQIINALDDVLGGASSRGIRDAMMPSLQQLNAI